MKSYNVTIWNEEVEKRYTILAETVKEAKERAIKAELERNVPFYKIHVEKVELW